MPTLETTILSGLPVEIDYSYTQSEVEINSIAYPHKKREKRTYLISEKVEKRITEKEWNSLYEQCYLNETESRYEYQKELY